MCTVNNREWLEWASGSEKTGEEDLAREEREKRPFRLHSFLSVLEKVASFSLCSGVSNTSQVALSHTSF